MIRSDRQKSTEILDFDWSGIEIFIVRIWRNLSFDWLIFGNLQGTLWYFCYLIFLGSQMIMTRMSHFFLSPTHANCVGGTYSYLWRHHDVSCLWYLLFKQIESRVWQINKYFTLGAVYLDALQVLGVIWSQGHMISRVKRSLEVKYCLYWILPLTRPSPNRGIQMNFHFYIYVI